MTDKKLALTITIVALLAASSALPAQAEPGGCLKYGAVGAVGGHVVHHGVVGALGGCASGMYVRHEYRKEARRKAVLFDQEHPGTKGTYEQKATAYDVEHSTTPGKMPAGTPAEAPGQAAGQI